MSALIHAIADDFPEFADKLAAMTEADAEFAGQLNGYDFRLRSRGDGNEYFSFVEVVRAGNEGEEEEGKAGKEGKEGKTV